MSQVANEQPLRGKDQGKDESQGEGELEDEEQKGDGERTLYT